MARARRYCFTSYRSDEEYCDLLGYGSENKDEEIHLPTGVQYICWGVEKCPTTGRIHLQGYVRFAKGVSRATVQRRLDNEGLHLSRCNGDELSNIRYCSKEEEAGGTFREFGTRAKPGKRVDLEEIREELGGGAGMRRVIELGTNYQGLRYAEKWLTYMEVPRDSAPEVRWYWGPTGTGKSYAAKTEAAERYGRDEIWWARAGIKWFQGYNGHKVALFDDFRPAWCKLHWLLRALDENPFGVENKGGERQWKPQCIYITCPLPPTDCYGDDGEDVDQLIRRIDVVREFKDRYVG